MRHDVSSPSYGACGASFSYHYSASLRLRLLTTFWNSSFSVRGRRRRLRG